MTPTGARLEIVPLAHVPEVAAGDDLAAIAAGAIAASEAAPARDGDVLVVAQKVVSKAEAMAVDLTTIRPRALALRIAAAGERDPRLVQVVLDQSRDLIRHRSGVVIAETVHGFVCANAGVDASNVPGDDTVMLLPRDADASARRLRTGLAQLTGATIGVIVADSFGRAWRTGQCDIAIGCAGVRPTIDLRGTRDREGHELTATETAVADELAAAADLARSKAGGEPLVLIRGRADFVTPDDGPGVAPLLRERSRDMFR